jgi:hypothetical protein
MSLTMGWQYVMLPREPLLPDLAEPADLAALAEEDADLAALPLRLSVS